MSNSRSNRNRRGNRSDGNGNGANAKNVGGRANSAAGRANNAAGRANTAAGRANTAGGGTTMAKNGSGNGGNNSRAGNGGGRQGEKGRSNSRRRKATRKKQIDPRVFWGDPEQLAAVGTEPAIITANPSAVVHSLGRPPLSGQQNAAEHYFVAVYERAVNLAAALAAAGDLLEPDQLDGDR